MMAGNPNQITGRVEIFIDGQYYPSLPGAKYTKGGVARKPVVGDRVHGYIEETVAPEIECEFAHKGIVSLTTIQAITNSTITFASDNGRRFVIRQGWCAPNPVLSADGGKISCKFNGMSDDEQ